MTIGSDMYAMINTIGHICGVILVLNGLRYMWEGWSEAKAEMKHRH